LKSNYHGQIDRLREQLTAAELSLQKALNDKDSYVERLQANCAKLMNEEVESDDATCSTSEIRERFLHKITLMEAEKSAQDDRLLKLQVSSNTCTSAQIYFIHIG
jgi:hypothetical protein